MRNRLLRFATYIAVGVATGFIVAMVALLAEKVLLAQVLHLPPWQRVIAPALGLWGAVIMLRRGSVVAAVNTADAEATVQLPAGCELMYETSAAGDGAPALLPAEVPLAPRSAIVCRVK